MTGKDIYELAATVADALPDEGAREQLAVLLEHAAFGSGARWETTQHGLQRWLRDAGYAGVRP